MNGGDRGSETAAYHERAVLDALEDAELDDLRALLGDDFAEEAEVAAAAGVLDANLRLEQLELPHSSNVEPFPPAKIREHEAARIAAVARDAREALAARFAVEADAFFRASEFGIAAPVRRSFSRHLKSEIRHLFPIDNDLFDACDRVQRNTIVDYFFHRSVVFALYLVFACLSVLIVSGYLDPAGWPAVASLSRMRMMSWAGEFWGALMLLVAGAGLLSFAGYVSGFFFLNRMNRHLDAAIGDLWRAMDEIRHNIYELSAQMAAVGEIWPGRAAGVMRASLWLAKRADYVSRYASIFQWKTDSGLRFLDLGFLVLKSLCAAAALGVLATMSVPKIDADTLLSPKTLGGAVLCAMFLAASFAGWRPLRRKWEEIFSRAALGEERSSDPLSSCVLKTVEKEQRSFMAGTIKFTPAKTSRAWLALERRLKAYQTA